MSKKSKGKTAAVAAQEETRREVGASSEQREKALREAARLESAHGSRESLETAVGLFRQAARLSAEREGFNWEVSLDGLFDAYDALSGGFKGTQRAEIWEGVIGQRQVEAGWEKLSPREKVAWEGLMSKHFSVRRVVEALLLDALIASGIGIGQLLKEWGGKEEEQLHSIIERMHRDLRRKEEIGDNESGGGVIEREREEKRRRLDWKNAEKKIERLEVKSREAKERVEEEQERQYGEIALKVCRVLENVGSDAGVAKAALASPTLERILVRLGMRLAQREDGTLEVVKVVPIEEFSEELPDHPVECVRCLRASLRASMREELRRRLDGEPLPLPTRSNKCVYSGGELVTGGAQKRLKDLLNSHFTAVVGTNPFESAAERGEYAKTVRGLLDLSDLQLFVEGEEVPVRLQASKGGKAGAGRFEVAPVGDTSIPLTQPVAFPSLEARHKTKGQEN